MKKRLLTGLLSVLTLALNGPAAQAWFGCHKCCKSKCCMNICVRPYNAFSPVCCGNITTIGGCCPMFGGGMGGMGGMGGGGPCCGPSCMPSCFSGGCAPSYASSGCCDSGCLPPAAGAPAPPAPNVPLSPMPNGPGPQNFTPPMPTPMSSNSQQVPAPMAYGYSGVQTVGYQPSYPAYQPSYYPGYYPGYTPAYYPGYSPMTPAVPAYWYGGSQ